MSVKSRAKPGREDDYDHWYDEVHKADMLTLSGILSCDRYRELDMQGKETGECIAQYAVETDDPAALLQSVFAATPTMRMTEAIDLESPQFTFLRPHQGKGA
ncbi:DUF4286 family protein [Sphingobium yanoikuyae]|nr:DUF4286 family protein [Sphingobium yanoikuyae]